MGIEVIEDKVAEVKATVDEVIEKAEGRVELAKSRVPWKLILIGFAVVVVLGVIVQSLV